MEFLVGANLPWVHYGIDFGANAWRPEGGMAQPSERAQLDAALDTLVETGVNTVRWFLLCDGRAGIRFADNGRPLGLDDFVLRDLEAALDAARRRGVRIMFALLDFLWCAPASIVRGVQLGGRSDVFRLPEQREALLSNVLRPILERYGGEPTIYAWDVVNEPEWIKSVSKDTVHGFLRDAIALVRASTAHPVTVGSAGVRWRDFYKDLDVDFYQVHWYDSLKHQPSLETSVDRLGFDRPVLLGEFPTRGSRKHASEILAAARAAGYAGAFYWSALADDKYSVPPAKRG
jgi:hypothetical protein